jgi:hypothetical protein
VIGPAPITSWNGYEIEPRAQVGLKVLSAASFNSQPVCIAAVVFSARLAISSVGEPEMDRQRWLAVSPYLDQALELPAEQVEGWLREIQSTEPLIAADVRRLVSVRTARAYASFLQTPAPLAAVIRFLILIETVPAARKQ